ncbi:MAG: hypothetical protein ACRCZP_15715 [Phycicoccus sp.]
MATTLYAITDTATGDEATVAAHDVVDTIGPWFPEAPAEITSAIDDLADALARHEDPTALADFLALIVVRA